jgi:hypothetical protein
VTTVWSHHSQQWPLLGAPLRPSPADVRVFERWARSACPDGGPSPRLALLLGVTPECARMGWPEGIELTAVNRSPEMIDAVWPTRGISVPARGRAGGPAGVLELFYGISC